MANVYEGFVSGKGLKFGIVVARFNEFITSKLLGGALDTLHRHETNDADIDVAWVPGAFELPIVAKKMAESGKYDAVICLGAVIRGSTTHYDYVCNEASKGIAQVGMQTGVVPCPPWRWSTCSRNSADRLPEKENDTETVDQACHRAAGPAVLLYQHTKIRKRTRKGNPYENRDHQRYTRPRDGLGPCLRALLQGC